MYNLTDIVSMTEAPNTATLEVPKSELERLERRIDELEADLSLISRVIQHLERIVLNQSTTASAKQAVSCLRLYERAYR
jgi:uncharacterized coiled-coil protein SlyX